MADLISQSGDFLLLQVTQVTVVILLVGLVTRLFCRNRPYVAFALWVVVLIKCVVPPLVYSPWGVFCWMDPISQEYQQSQGLQLTTIDAADSHFTAADRPRAFDAGLRNASFPVDNDNHSHSLAAVRAGNARFGDTAWTTLGLTVWLSGAVILLFVYALRCHLFLKRVKQEGQSATAAELFPAVERLVRRLSRYVGLSSTPRLVLSDNNVGPAVFGLRHPTMILPTALVERVNSRELAPIVLHELMHVRRGDLWLAMYSVLVRAIWWFHPLVWWSVRRAEWESERCCDESVVSCMRRNPARYAHSLINALELSHQLRSSSLVPGVRPVDITAKRLERIMKLGQGSHRRMSMGCWSLAILAAALILPGAAGGLAQSTEALDQGKELVEADQLPVIDRRVKQASHDAVGSIEQLARRKAASPSVTKSYDVADVLAKMKREEKWADDVADEQVKQAFLNHLLSFSFRFHTPLESAPQNSQSLKQQTRLAWSGDRLVVSGPVSAHERLVKEIELRRKHSFEQVTIEVRIIRSDRDLCAQDEVDAAATPEDGSAFWKNRWVLFQQDFAAAEPVLLSPSPELNGLPSRAQAEPTNRPLASVTTGTSDPIVYQFLDDELFRSFLNFCQEDERNPIDLAPKVTLFDGQTAEILDCSQRPFVTDVTKVVGDAGVAYQPLIQLFWEGTKIQLAPAITPDGHRMNCLFRFASIDGCKTFRPARYPDANDVRVQHPVVTTACLECAIDIPTGQTLLVGGLFPRRVERKVRQNAIGRLLGRKSTKVASEMTYIAITPRAVSAEE